jgi:hypothetical protein
MKKYLRSYPEKSGYSKTIQSKYDQRIIEYATKAIEDLTLIMEKTPEDLQAKIFTERYLKQFFKCLFNVGTYIESTERKPDHFSSDLGAKSERMLNVCNLALDQIAFRRNALVLAPKAWRIIKELPSSNNDEIYGTNIIQAIQIERSLIPPKSVDEAFSRYEGKKTNV